jgi:hypothetical protein
MTNAVNIAQAASSTYSFKNRIINGGMQIDQRNNGAAYTPSSGSFNYTLDRWQLVETQTSKLTVQQNYGSVTPPTGFTNYLGMYVASSATIGAGDIFGMIQHIEGYNVSDFAYGTASAATCTLSFWVYSSVTGNFGIVLKNSAGNRSYATTYSIPVANTWTQISLVIPGDTSVAIGNTTNGSGLEPRWGLGVGSTYNAPSNNTWLTGDYYGAASVTATPITTGSATFYLTGVQLEKGTQATSFDYRPYGTELQLCQRYFESNAPFGSAPADNKGYPDRHLMLAWSTTTAGANFTFQVAKRAAPTITFYSSSNANTAGKWCYYNGSWNVFTSQTVGFNTPYGFAVDAAGTSLSGTYITSGGWSASSEL